MKKFFFFLFLIAIAFYLGFIFRIGFAIIVRPPFGNSEAETLQNMKDFCFHKGLENLVVSSAVGLFLFSIAYQFIFKNFKNALFIFFLFIFLTNLGNIWGMMENYCGFQSEFKYHF